jgi:hypothetical protein
LHNPRFHSTSSFYRKILLRLNINLEIWKDYNITTFLEKELKFRVSRLNKYLCNLV